jgi:hypothetical protein
MPRFVSGHDFSRAADRAKSWGFSPCCGKSCEKSGSRATLSGVQGLKPSCTYLFAARLKSCPDTKRGILSYDTDSFGTHHGLFSSLRTIIFVCRGHGHGRNGVLPGRPAVEAAIRIRITSLATERYVLTRANGERNCRTGSCGVARGSIGQNECGG